MRKIILIALYISSISSYNQPTTLNLGYTNIQLGGPIKPTSGWSMTQYLSFYHSNKFLDYQGKTLNKTASPHFNSFWGVTDFNYKTEDKIIFNAQAGIDIIPLYAFYSKIEKNSLDITNSGGGISDPYIGVFLQWEPFYKKNRPIFVHRFELFTAFPMGKYKRGYSINPGNGCYFINPSWASTLYLTRKFAISSAWSYLWSSEKKYTGIQPGQAILLNYSIEYECLENFWIAICGYALKQFTSDKKYGVTLAHSLEQVLSVGPGFLYTFRDKFNLYGYFYCDQLVRNRAQTISLFLRLSAQFYE
ncbi:MAG: transporter [Candidatus Babeliaceae bacterium]|nr:transporter [Candidatus Babeliaceae bacterium]